MGIALYAPAVVLTVILGWPGPADHPADGRLVVIYYASIGGIKAVAWTDVQQMIIMLFGLLIALTMAIHLLPDGVSLLRRPVTSPARPGG